MSTDMSMAKQKIVDYCKFQPDETYILLLLARKKENEEQVESQKEKRAQRFLIQSEEEVNMGLDLFQRTIDLFPDVVYRVYLSVNPRSLLKGLHHIQKNILDIQYNLLNGNQETYSQVQRLGSEWKSVLANKKCRADRRFLWDVDFKGREEELDDLIDKVEVQEVFYWDNTKSGQAIVTSPFNLQLLPPTENLSIKTDSYLFLDIFNNKDNVRLTLDRDELS